MASTGGDLQNVTFDLDLITWQLFDSLRLFFLFFFVGLPKKIVAKINSQEGAKNQMTLGAIYARNYRRKGVPRDE